MLLVRASIGLLLYNGTGTHRTHTPTAAAKSAASFLAFTVLTAAHVLR